MIVISSNFRAPFVEVLLGVSPFNVTLGTPGSSAIGGAIDEGETGTFQILLPPTRCLGEEGKSGISARVKLQFKDFSPQHNGTCGHLGHVMVGTGGSRLRLSQMQQLERHSSAYVKFSQKLVPCCVNDCIGVLSMWRVPDDKKWIGQHYGATPMAPRIRWPCASKDDRFRWLPQLPAVSCMASAHNGPNPRGLRFCGS